VYKEDPHWCSATGLPKEGGDHHFGEFVAQRMCECPWFVEWLVVLLLSVAGCNICVHKEPIVLVVGLGGQG